jgi:hypothetical protein
MASQVPYNPVPTESPQLNPLPQAHVDTPIAAFGGATADALTHMGTVAEGAGKELFDRAYAMQELNEQVKADGASADTMDKQLKLYLDYDKLQGQARIDGYQGYVDGLKSIRDDGMQGLNSPYAKMQYLRDTRRNESTMLWHGGMLARTGGDEAAVNGAHSLMNAAVDSAVTISSNDPKEYNKALDGMTSAASLLVTQQFHLNPGDPGFNEKLAEIKSDKASGIIKGLLSGNDPEKAQSLMNSWAKSGVLQPADLDLIKERVDDAVDNKAAHKLGVQTYINNSDKGVDDVADATRAAAEKEAPGNKIFADNAVLAARERANTEATAKQHSQEGAYQSAFNIIDGVTTNGKVPLTWDDAMQNHDFSDVVGSGNLTQKQIYDLKRKVFENNTTDGWKPNLLGTGQFNELSRIGSLPQEATPKELDKLLGWDFTGDSMTREQRQSVMKLQGMVLKAQGAPSNVSTLINTPEVRKVMMDEGLTDKNDPRYNQFVTAFGAAVEGFEQGAHRTVKGMDELGGIAKKLAAHQDETFGGWFGKNTRAYEDILEEQGKLDSTKKHWRVTHGGVDPTEDDLEAIRLEMIRQMYNGLGAGSGAQQPKSTNRVP